MGANEHNLVIGNEAVFSRIPAQKRPMLLGTRLAFSFHCDVLKLGVISWYIMNNMSN